MASPFLHGVYARMKQDTTTDEACEEAGEEDGGEAAAFSGCYGVIGLGKCSGRTWKSWMDRSGRRGQIGLSG